MPPWRYAASGDNGTFLQDPLSWWWKILVPAKRDTIAGWYSMVKCEDCGYLGQYDTTTVGRKSEHLELLTKERSGEWELPPIPELSCIAQRWTAYPEWHRCNKSWNQLIQAERECNSFVPYQPGFTPKEHLKQQQEHEVREDQRAWQKKMLQYNVKGLFAVGLIVAAISVGLQLLTSYLSAD